MDFLDIIITVAILLAGGLMTGGKKKPVRQSRQTPAGMNTPTDNMPRGFLFDEDDDIEEDIFEDESVETPAPQVETPYFTYEDLSVDNAAQSAPMQDAPAQANPVQTAPVSEPLRIVDDEPVEHPQFDLRQALIYQSILQNNYISELK